MKEDFLYYLWKYQKMNSSNLVTTQGESLDVLAVGRHNVESSGPDFFNAQIIIDNQKWVGTVEIHVKSSDWFAHSHHEDINYNTVILHVVWEHDIEVFRATNEPIPVLQLKDYVSDVKLESYKKLFENNTHKWINCEKHISEIPSFIVNNWLERLYFERLEAKSLPIKNVLEQNNNNWEATCFIILAKAFGGNSNGEVFMKIARSIPFAIIKKMNTAFKMEALLFGQANQLNAMIDVPYYKLLKKEYEYHKHVFKLEPLIGLNVQFFKLRPSNFPTIRLSQLAVFYCSYANIFSKLRVINSLNDFKKIFSIQSSEFWNTHYTFTKTSKKSIKKLSKSFIELVLINAVLPLKFIFETQTQNFEVENFIKIIEKLPHEKNTIINQFQLLGVDVTNAMKSQALLTLKKEYCDTNKCLNCAIGHALLK